MLLRFLDPVTKKIKEISNTSHKATLLCCLGSVIKIVRLKFGSCYTLTLKLFWHLRNEINWKYKQKCVYVLILVITGRQPSFFDFRKWLGTCCNRQLTSCIYSFGRGGGPKLHGKGFLRVATRALFVKKSKHSFEPVLLKKQQWV